MLAQAKSNYGKATLAFYILFALILLFPRIEDSSGLPGKYLWAEDGYVFINEVQSDGIQSIVKPYNGYLHMYPRLVTYIGGQFSLAWMPYFTFGGWVLAYVFLMLAALRASRILGIGLFSAFTLSALVSLQPHYGENLFNITNSQWMCGATLMLFILFEKEKEESPLFLKALCILVLGLSGPFSIILSPVVFLKWILERSWDRRVVYYLLCFLCAAIQFIVLVVFGRTVPQTVLNQNIWDWYLSFSQMIFFGAKDISTFGCALGFWGIVGYCFIKQSQSNSDEKKPKTFLYLLGATFLLILASLYGHKSNPLLVAAVGGGNRYTWIPYVLIFTLAIGISWKYKFLHLLLIAFSGWICFIQFHQVKSENYQFESYAQFSKYRDLIIPINPAWPTYPGWYVQGRAQDIDKKLDSITLSIDPQNWKFAHIEPIVNAERFEFNSTGVDPILVYKAPIRTKEYGHVLVEIDCERSLEGKMQFFWGDHPSSFSEERSLKRLYPKGEIKAEFSFPVVGDEMFFRFDPLETKGKVKIKKITVYFL